MVFIIYCVVACDAGIIDSSEYDDSVQVALEVLAVPRGKS